MSESVCNIQYLVVNVSVRIISQASGQIVTRKLDASRFLNKNIVKK